MIVSRAVSQHRPKREMLKTQHVAVFGMVLDNVDLQMSKILDFGVIRLKCYEGVIWYKMW